ncbi:MAG: MFS transporter [Ottowia sp.]
MSSSAVSAASGPLPVVPLREDAKVIGLVGLAHASSHFSHLLLPPLFPVFATEFGLSFSQLGLLMSVFFVISGAGQAMSGFLVDKVGARPVLFSSFVCFILASLSGYFAHSYAGLMLVAVFAGLGNAPFHPVDFSILNHRVSAAAPGLRLQRPRAVGQSGLGADASVPAVLHRAGGLAQRLPGGGGCCTRASWPCWCSSARTCGPKPWCTTRMALPHASGAGFLRLPVVWWCFAFFLLSTLTLAVVQNFASPIMKAMHGVSFEAATTMITAYMLCGAFGMLVGGFVAARIPAASDRVVAWAMGAGALLIVVTATGWLGGFGSMAVLAGTGFAVGVGGPSRDLMIKKATPKGATGRIYGTVYSGLDIGFAIGPLIYGIFMDRGMYATTLVLAGVFLALSVVAALGVGRRTPSA